MTNPKKKVSKKKVKKIVLFKRGISLKDRYSAIDLKQSLMFIETTAHDLEIKLTAIIRKDNYWNRDDIDTIEMAKKFITRYKVRA